MSAASQAPPQRIPPLRRGGRSRRFKLALLAFMLVPFVLAVYGYNVERNARARSKVRESCRAMERALDRWWQPAIMGPFFGGDASQVRADLRAVVRDNCAALEDRLVWWRFNLKMKMRAPESPARAERLERALSRATARCPAAVRALFADFFQALSVPQPERSRAEEELCGLLRSAPQLTGGRQPEREVWAWADDYERVGEIIARREAGAPLGAPPARKKAP